MLLTIIIAHPEILKRALVVPIFKSADSIMASNYRPINVFSDAQFGFRRKCNTTLAAFYWVANLVKSFHYKTYSISLFLNLRNAFDTVNVEILLETLKMYGIRDTASLLINSYFTNRDQYTLCNEYKSYVYLLMQEFRRDPFWDPCCLIFPNLE